MPNCITETVIQTFYPEYGKRDGTFDRSEKEQDKNVLFYPSDSLKKTTLVRTFILGFTILFKLTLNQYNINLIYTKRMTCFHFIKIINYTN